MYQFLLLFVSIATLLFAFLFVKFSQLCAKYDGIPYRKPRWPIVGNALEMVLHKGSLSKQLFDRINDLHKYEKDGLFVLYLAFYPLVFIFKPSIVNRLLKDPKTVSKPKDYDLVKFWLGEGLLLSTGQKWRSRRKLLSHAFSTGILHSSIDAINEQVYVMIDILKRKEANTVVDVRSLINRCVLDIVSVTAMGTSLNSQTDENNEYHKCLHVVLGTWAMRFLNPIMWVDFIFYRLKEGKMYKQSVETLHNITYDVINKRKAAFDEESDFEGKSRNVPFLDLLLRCQKEDKTITDIDIREEVDTFMFAGHDTSAVSLAWTLLLIGHHPNVQMKIKQELETIFGDDKDRYATADDLKQMNYIECVIKEGLRLNPPVPIVGRILDEDVVIDGRRFEKGVPLYFAIYALNRNSEVFPKPEEYIPERFESEESNPDMKAIFLPFAAGPRNCIGQHSAMITMKLVIANIFRHFTIKSITKEEEIDRLSEGILRAGNSINIRFDVD